MADVTRIQLEKVSDISKVEQLHEALEACLGASAGVEIDASAVERIDTSTLQLLAAFFRTAPTHHLEVRITQPSTSFGESVRLTGLGGVLDLQH